MKLKRKKYLIVLILVLFLSIGFALLTSNLSITGLGIFKPNTWDIHFANIVDDGSEAELTVPATIDKDGLNINFDVDLNNLGDNYYFYVDIVNDGTIDAMIDAWKLSGITSDVENFIKASVTYADGVELNNYDLLPKKSNDKLKVAVEYSDEFIGSNNDLPKIDGEITLTLNINYIQADEKATVREKRADTESPVVRVNKNEKSVQGNNRWYKNLTLNTKLIDPSGISSAKYCATTSDSCTPDNPVELTNNSFNIRLDNSKTPWTICIETTDSAENKDTYCDKNKYYVDGEDPTISNITVTPADLSMRVELTSSDNHSGVDKYYYSKDGGTSYISSDKPNYTFSSLTANDYIVMAYVEDAAGNRSDTTTAATTVREYSWCEKNEITNLGDCAIATEAHNSDIAEAKKEIEDKGQPDFSKTSPTYTYKEKHSSVVTKMTTINSTVSYSTSYTFDNKTGQYSIKDYTVSELGDIDLDSGKIYSCVNSTNTSCSTLYELESISTQDSKGYYTVEKYDYTYDVDNYDVTGIGMYEAEDDTGKSYYYRGSVGGNFVEFAGMYWRIIRINGDGSVRLIYFGDDTSNGKSIKDDAFNYAGWDPTYTGFMYNGRDFSKQEIISKDGVTSVLSENATYYYAKDYEYNAETKRFKLKGSVENNDIIGAVWKKDYNKLLTEGYVYSCFVTSPKTECDVLIKIKSYGGVNQAKTNYISYSSTSYQNAIMNIQASNALLQLNDWFNTNITNKKDESQISYKNYIADEVFCNDRTLNQQTLGDGYSFVPTTTYGSYYRINNTKTPSLICPNDNDKFTQSSNIGNGMLESFNPVGLITIDEVVLAGGAYNLPNALYYLNYKNNSVFWTMSPCRYLDSYHDAYEWAVTGNGAISVWGFVSNKHGLRPVINLKSDLKLSSGNGTADNPYKVKLN